VHFRGSCAPHGPRCPDPTASAACPNLTDDNNKVSGRIGVDWKPNSAVLAYASFSRGYRGAAFNGQAYNAPAELNFASLERLDSFELGLKTLLWDRRAELNAAAFHYDYRNQQFLDTLSSTGWRHWVSYGQCTEVARDWRRARAAGGFRCRIPPRPASTSGSGSRTWPTAATSRTALPSATPRTVPLALITRWWASLALTVSTLRTGSDASNDLATLTVRDCPTQDNALPGKLNASRMGSPTEGRMVSPTQELRPKLQTN